MSARALLGPELLRLGIVFHWPSWERVSDGFDPDRYIRILKRIGIETVTIEAKDELGWSYHPTDHGIPHPRMVGDYYGQRHRLLKDNGFRVIAYFNIGVQGRLFDAHPDWLAQHNAPAEVSPPPPDGHALASFFSPYLEENLIPHLEEFVGRYDMDELWLDIFPPWQDTLLDFNPHSRARFEEDTGRKLLPLADDPDPGATRRYFRDRALAIRKRLCHCVRRIRPGLRVAVNAAYRWPECRYQDDVTWLSWDVNAPGCRLGMMAQLGCLGRLYASYPLPSDIVLPNLWKWGSTDLKPAEVLCRDAASLLAAGTAVYAYDTAQPPGGNFDEARLAPFVELADFVRARRDVFLRGDRPAEILLLTSAAAHGAGKLNNPTVNVEHAPAAHRLRALQPPVHWGANQQAAACGATQLLQAHGYVFRFAAEDCLESLWPSCRLLVLPQQLALDEETGERVRRYVEDGGRLLIAGPVPECLQSWLGVTGDPLAPPRAGGYLQTVDGQPAYPQAFRAPYHALRCPAGSVALRYFYPSHLEGDLENKPFYLAKFFGRRTGRAEAAGWVLSAGRGRVFVCAADIFGAYWEHPGLGLVEIWESILASLAFEASVRVDSCYPVEVVTAREKDGLLVHLVNQLDAQDRLFYPLRVPPIPSLRLTVLASTPPRAVTRWPEGQGLEPVIEKGCVTVDLKDVHIHACVEFAGIGS